MADEIKNEVAEEENVEATETGAEDGKAKKKGKKKWPIVLGIVVVVVVAAGAGFMVWHEQPSFCNAICHTPMDAYVETYLEGTTDKYGNELEDEDAQNAMMAYLHGNSLDEETVTCLDCHVPQLSEQITEGINWITGSYTIEGTNSDGNAVLETRTLEDLVEARGLEDETEFCLNDSCHHVDADGNAIETTEDLEAATADLSDTYNPHSTTSHMSSSVTCSDCHKAHSQSVNYCTSCHSEAPVPDGWLTMSEYNSLAQITESSE